MRVKAHFFGRDAIQQHLDQEGCVGIRMYNAFDDNEKPPLVLVGVDANEKDLCAGPISDYGANNALNS